MKIKKLIQNIAQFPYRKHLDRIGIKGSVLPFGLAGGFLFIILIVQLLFFGTSSKKSILLQSHDPNFQNGRILADRENSFYYNREKMMSKTTQNLLESNQKLEAKLNELEKKIGEGAVKNAATDSKDTRTTASDGPRSALNMGTEISKENQTSPNQPPVTDLPNQNEKSQELQFFSGPESYVGQRVSSRSYRGSFVGQRRGSSNDLISFPVKGEAEPDGLVLPSGSYVKGKIITGVDVPEGKTYPVLMVLDYSYVAPNDHKIDLSGCFMIAKAEGDLSTERVQMQATKMSCVSKRGKMFEREINGFIADDQDGSFAMKGQVNSKQGRVAAVAFLASVVDGVGKAVQAAQTTQSVNALGGSQSALTGDTGKYIAAGGASNAASMVAQWYLQQAQALAPTVSVNSGRDVWIVIKDKVSLPYEFFRKESRPNDEDIYSFITRVVD